MTAFMISKPTDFDGSRRRFVLRAGALALAPAVLTACRRGEETPIADAAKPADTPRNLDDVGSLATFRPPLPTVEPVVRVRVLRVREPSPRPWLIGRENQWLMMHSATASAKAQALQGPVEIEMTQRGWSVVDGKGFRAAVEPLNVFEIQLSAAEPDGLIDVRGSSEAQRRYRGLLRFVPRDDLDDRHPDSGEVIRRLCGFDIVNDVAVEQYLPGVLAGELYASWHLETFAAQAVAARSFACTEASIFAGRRHYDLTNTAASQMYLGAVSHDRAHEAVAATRGKVLAYQDLLVSGYYSSCCGGVAACATDAIGSNPVNNVEPLRGRSGSDVCSEASVFRWIIEQPADAVAGRIAAYARDRSLSELKDLRAVEAIDISASNPHGRPTRMAIVDQNLMQTEMSAEEFRRAVNFGDSSGTIKPPDKELRSSNVRTSVTRSTIRFEGFGFGHGVGLCQHGAQILARDGTRFEDILRWYYPGVSLARAYG